MALWPLGIAGYCLIGWGLYLLAAESGYAGKSVSTRELRILDVLFFLIFWPLHLAIAGILIWDARSARHGKGQ